MLFSDLYRHEFNVSQMVCLTQHWQKGDAYSYLQNPRPNFGLFYMKKGTAVCLTKAKECIIQTGDLFFAPRGCRYEILFENENVDNFLLNFALTNEQGDFLPLEPEISHVKSLLRIQTLDLFQMLNSNTAPPAHCKSALLLLLCNLSLSTQQERYALCSPIHPALDYIDRNFKNESLRISELAKMCHTSESHFRRAFHKQQGCSPKAYITALQIKRANLLLQQPELTISDVAEDLGFEDVSYFIRFYKKNTGHTPAQIRKN